SLAAFVTTIVERASKGDQEVAAHLAVWGVLELDRPESAFVVLGGSLEGQLAHRTVSGAAGEVDGLRRVPRERAFAVVIRELVEVRFDVGTATRLDGFPHAPVHPHPLGRRQLL